MYWCISDKRYFSEEETRVVQGETTACGEELKKLRIFSLMNTYLMIVEER